MKNVFIVAGGTGGHINAALAMGEVFEDIFDVKYLTGERYLDYQLFKGKNVTHLASRPLRTKNVVKLFINLAMNILVFTKIFMTYICNRPVFVLGAGGYICGPTLFAAKILLIPIYIIEQNAVVGVTNKILSKISNLVFTNFENTKGIKKSSKIVVTGNPVRRSIVESRNEICEKLKILIFGGSLGATQINEAIEFLLKESKLENVEVIHQVGKGNIKNFKIEKSNIEYIEKEYLEDMQKEYAWANIIICRAGASTVSELRIVKKPAIIIPYPAATDNHQYYNALELKKENGFFVDVLDYTKKGMELASLIEKSIDNIQKNSLYYNNEVKRQNACQIIKKEILKNVRNK